MQKSSMWTLQQKKTHLYKSLLLIIEKQLRDERRLKTQHTKKKRSREKESHKNITFTASMTILTFHIEKY